MRTILVLNAKGGCGKSTLATNLAGYYASQGGRVLLADFDPQGSSLGWLKARAKNRPAIEGIAGWREPVKAQEKPDYLIFDAPARAAGSELNFLLRHARDIIIPVVPSPIDIRACADYIRDLMLARTALRHEGRIAVVANRVREHTIIYDKLKRFLLGLDIPFIATLRETQNYIRAAEQGVGIFELTGGNTTADTAQWKPLLEWLERT